MIAAVGSLVSSKMTSKVVSPSAALVFAPLRLSDEDSLLGHSYSWSAARNFYDPALGVTLT